MDYYTLLRMLSPYDIKKRAGQQYIYILALLRSKRCNFLSMAGSIPERFL